MLLTVLLGGDWGSGGGGGGGVCVCVCGGGGGGGEAISKLKGAGATRALPCSYLDVSCLPCLFSRLSH